MSLSKYFKDSSSFQREEIVKPSPDSKKGWNTDSAPSSTPFEREENITYEPKDLHQDTQIPNSAEVAPSQEPAPSEPPTPTPSPAAPSIDLNKYILIEEADKRAQEKYTEGFQDGVQKAAEDYKSAAGALSSSCHQLDTIRNTIISNSSIELLQFTLLIAEKILRISLKEQDQTIVATVEEALLRAVKSEEFTIFIHPDDYQIIADRSEEIIGSISGLSNIVLKTDATIEKGGAKIESENCIIDATISSQFESIREELFPTETPINPTAE